MNTGVHDTNAEGLLALITASKNVGFNAKLETEYAKIVNRVDKLF